MSTIDVTAHALYRKPDLIYNAQSLQGPIVKPMILSRWPNERDHHSLISSLTPGQDLRMRFGESHDHLPSFSKTIRLVYSGLQVNGAEEG